MDKMYSMFGGLALLAGLSAVTANATTIIVDLSQDANSTAASGTTADGLHSIFYNKYQVGLNPSAAGSTLASLQDTSGNATGVSVQRSTGIGGSNNNGLNTGVTLGGAAAALFPNTAGQTFGFVNPNATVDGSFAEFTFANLDGTGNSTYAFDIFSARAGSGPRVSDFTATGANTGTGSVDSAFNTDNLVHITGITPTAGGQIVLRVANGTANQYGYINAVQMTSSAVPEPTMLGLMGLSVVTLMARRRHA